MKVTSVGVDLAKSVLLLHGVNEWGKPIIKKPLKRNPVDIP
jgi:hypothetical protein